MRKGWVTILGVVTFILVVVVLAGANAYSRNKQRSDFQQDLNAIGLTVVSVAWEDERGEPSELEAVIKVAGCNVELERADGEDVVRTNVGNAGERRIESYVIDGVVVGRREVATDTYTGGPWPTPASLRAYVLNQGKAVFGCADANA